MKNNKFNSRRYILAIDDLLDLIKRADNQLLVHQKSAEPSELIINQYRELKLRYATELNQLMSELNQEVQHFAAVAA